jgi:putative flippase GtrA
MASLAPAAILAFMRSFLQDRILRRKAITFACIGVVNTIVDFSVFSFAHLYLQIPIIPANMTSWVVAVSGSFVMNSLITFAAESGGRLRLKSYGLFVAAQVTGLVANTTTVFIASFFVHVLVGKTLAIGVSFLVDFSLSHFIVFGPHRRPGDGEPAGGEPAAVKTERRR